MDVIFGNICMNRLAIEKLCRVTSKICTVVGVSAICTMVSLYYMMEKQDELEQRIECLEMEGDNTSKKGE